MPTLMRAYEQVTDKKSAKDAWELVNRNQRLTLKAAAEQAKVHCNSFPASFDPRQLVFWLIPRRLPSPLPLHLPQISLDETTNKFASLKV